MWRLARWGMIVLLALGATESPQPRWESGETDRRVLRVIPRMSDRLIEIARDKGASVEVSIPQIGAHAVAGDRTVVERIIRIASREGILLGTEAVGVGRVSGEFRAIPDDPQFPQQTAWQHIEADKAWDITSGSPDVVVALLDTGVDPTHPDLADNLLPGQDFIDGDADPDDQYGHGTGMAGVIAARGNNGIGIAGITWNCKILPVRVADRRGLALSPVVAKGIVFAADQGARVICVGVAEILNSRFLRDAVEYAREKGAIVVAPAGNRGASHDFFPAGFDNAIGVTASTSDDRLVPYANVGWATDLAAPGEDILTTRQGKRFARFEGTSASAAIAAGTAALMLSANPQITPKQIHEILRNSADPIQIDNFAKFFRFGRLNVRKAVVAAAATAGNPRLTRLEPRPWRPLAGAPFEVTVSLFNASPVAAKGALVRLFLDGSEVTSKSVSMGGFKSKAVKLKVPGTTAGSHAVSATVTAGGDPDETDNSSAVSVIVSSDSFTDAGLLPVKIAFPKADVSEKGGLRGPFKFTVPVKNFGNADCAGVKVSAVIGNVSLGSKTVGRLKPGRTKQAVFRWSPPQEVDDDEFVLTLSLSGSSSDQDPRDNEAVVRIVHDPRSAFALTQYPDLPLYDVITDAPWFVHLRGGVNYVPVMLYVPDVHWEGVTVKDFDIKTQGPQGEVSLFVDLDPTDPPEVMAGDVRIVNERGDETARLFEASEATPILEFNGTIRKANRGRYRIIRIPESSLPGNAGASRVVTLETQAFIRQRLQTAKVLYTAVARRQLRVMLSTTPLANFQAADHQGAWRYLDTHAHTLLEQNFSNFSFQNLLEPREGFCGPLHMLGEAAQSIGFTDSPDVAALQDRVPVTDHTPYFFDRWQPRFGPTGSDPALGEGIGPQQEFARMQQLFAGGLGEEITLKSPPGRAINVTEGLPVIGQVGVQFDLGAHILTYRPPNTLGNPGTHKNWWHGSADLSIWGVIPLFRFGQIGLFLHQPNEVDPAVLLAQLRQANGFAYAAHPMNAARVENGIANARQLGTGTSQYDLERLIGLGEHNIRNVVSAQNEFLFKGYQCFNNRRTQGRNDVPSRTFDRLDIFDAAGKIQGAAAQKRDEEFDLAFIDLRQKLRQTLRYRFSDAENVVFIRKLYLAAGSDAHGDFNFSTSVASPLLTAAEEDGVDPDTRERIVGEGLDQFVGEMMRRGGNFNWRAIHDGAYGRTRTLARVTYADRAGKNALRAFEEGNTILTDGPILNVTLDAQLQYNSDGFDNGTEVPARRHHWNFFRTKSENDDGVMGGDGKFDGGYTMLYPLTLRGDTRISRARYLWRSSVRLDSDPTTTQPIQRILIFSDRSGQSVQFVDADADGFADHEAELAVPAEGAFEEALVDDLLPGAVGALTFAAFTDTDPRRTGRDRYRCYTNPIFTHEVTITVPKRQVTVDGNYVIQPGDLVVEFLFLLSMSGDANTAVFIKEIDPVTGKSIDTNPIPLKTTAWQNAGGVRNALYSATNAVPIVLGPAAPGSSIQKTFVVYIVGREGLTGAEAEKWGAGGKGIADFHGNRLNSLARAFSVFAAKPE